MKHGFDLFSDYFALRDNRLTRVDARVKLSVALGCIISVLVSQNPLYCLVMFLVFSAGVLVIRVPVKIYVLRMVPAVLVGVGLVVLKALFTPGAEVWGVDAGTFRISVTGEGIADGTVVACRVLGAVSVVLLLSFVTPAYKIFLSLLWFKVPRLWVETAMMTYHAIFSLLENTAEVATAQRCRLGYVNSRKSLSSIGTLAGAVVLRAFEQSERTAEAMKTRCYRGNVFNGGLEPIRGKDAALIAASLAVVAITCLLFQGWVL